MSASRPTVAATGLPVEEAIGAVRLALGEVGAAVLVAPPGAGKTTAVPLRLLGEPWLGDQRIVVLEPRRLAARAAAERMAELLGGPVGETVGYRTRDERRVGRRTRIEVVTEGILVRRIQADPSLEGTGLVILDEVHERNLVTDLSLALLLDVRGGLRPDLRVLAMSATLDADRLAGLLGDGPSSPAPVVRSEGRTHAVEVRHVVPGPATGSTPSSGERWARSSPSVPKATCWRSSRGGRRAAGGRSPPGPGRPAARRGRPTPVGPRTTAPSRTSPWRRARRPPAGGGEHRHR
ncbi:MAG: DEAD/DEAH box helicase [Acidimicrobiales bacterium]